MTTKTKTAEQLFKTDRKSLPKGWRNNNPMNMILSAIPWQGKIYVGKTDGSFEEFISPEYGIRAGIINVITKLKRGTNTPTLLANVYSPKDDGTAINKGNDPAAYAMIMAKAIGGNINSKIDHTNKLQLAKLASAIITHENGAKYPAPLSMITNVIQTYQL